MSEKNNQLSLRHQMLYQRYLAKDSEGKVQSFRDEISSRLIDSEPYRLNQEILFTDLQTTKEGIPLSGLKQVTNFSHDGKSLKTDPYKDEIDLMDLQGLLPKDILEIDVETGNLNEGRPHVISFVLESSERNEAQKIQGFRKSINCCKRKWKSPVYRFHWTCLQSLQRK